MKKTSPRHLLQAIQLSNRLEEDIKLRKLRPGSAYFTTAEASKFLKVAGIYANDALQLLEKRQVIRRRQRSGAVVLDLVPRKETFVSNLYLLVREFAFHQEGFVAGEFLSGIQLELPLSMVSYILLTPDNEDTVIPNIISKSLSNNEIDGFVLASASYKVQQTIAKSRLPAVIHGTPYPAVRTIPSIERDHVAAQRGIVQYLRARNRKRFAWLFRDEFRPGDSVIFGAVRKFREFTRDAPVLFTTAENEEIAAKVRAVMDCEDRPDALICHSLPQAEAAEMVLLDMGIIPYRDVDIVVSSYYFDRGTRARYTHIEFNISSESLGRKIGTMIQMVAQGQPVKSEKLSVKVVSCPRSLQHSFGE